LFFRFLLLGWNVLFMSSGSKNRLPLYQKTMAIPTQSSDGRSPEWWDFPCVPSQNVLLSWKRMSHVGVLIRCGQPTSGLFFLQ
jgi:hypothetical protein